MLQTQSVSASFGFLTQFYAVDIGGHLEIQGSVPGWSIHNVVLGKTNCVLLIYDGTLVRRCVVFHAQK